MTEAQIRLQLQTEELQEVMNVLVKSVKQISISAFLIMGLELENVQYVVLFVHLAHFQLFG